MKLYQEDDKYFLRLDFDYEDDYGYFKGHIERIEFNFRLMGIIQEDSDWHNLRLHTKVFVDLDWIKGCRFYQMKTSILL